MERNLEGKGRQMARQQKAAPRSASARSAGRVKGSGESHRGRQRYQRYHQLDEPQVAQVLVTVEQAATALAMCRYTVNKLIASGELPSIKIGRMRRVPTASLEEFVRRRLPVDSSVA